MELTEILPQLKAWFPPSAHKERDLKGGGQWWYVPWQIIRDRLDEVCPGEWAVSYGNPSYLGDYCHISCTLSICGVCREGVGSAEIQLLSSSGKNMARGNPIERATADAFKNAAEQFGLAAYLDEQTDNKKRFVVYMQRAGNGKPAAEFQKELREEAGLPPKARPINPKPPTAQTYPENLARFRKLTTFLGFKGSKGDEFIKTAMDQRYPGQKSDQLIPLYARRVVDQILINYAAPTYPGGAEAAEMTYHAEIANNPAMDRATDEETAKRWLQIIQAAIGAREAIASR